jgi:hypothetical protein
MQAATHDEKQALNSSGSIPLITVLSQSTQGPFLIRQIDGHIRTEARQCPGKAEIDPVKAAERFIDRHVTGEKRPPTPSLRRSADHALQVGGRKTRA